MVEAHCGNCAVRIERCQNRCGIESGCRRMSLGRSAAFREIWREPFSLNERRKFRDGCRLVIVGTFMHDLGAAPFGEANQMQVVVFKRWGELRLFDGKLFADALEYFSGYEIGLADERDPRERVFIGN